MDDQTDVNTADPDAPIAEGAPALNEPATPGTEPEVAPAATADEAATEATHPDASEAESVDASEAPAEVPETVAEADETTTAETASDEPEQEQDPAPVATPADRAAHRAEEQRRVDALWDFSAPEVSIERFRTEAENPEHSAHLRSVFATQLARAFGLAGRNDDAVAVLDAIEPDPADGELRARVALERGRLATTSDLEHAVATLTYAAREAALAADLFLALDALHMLALIDAGHEEEWAEEGFAVLAASREPRVLRWGVALHNNLGWTLHDAGRAEEALARFEEASRYAERFGTAEQRHVARWAIGRCLRTLGRTEEATAIQRELAEARPDDVYVVAELRELGVLQDVSEDAPTIEA